MAKPSAEVTITHGGVATTPAPLNWDHWRQRRRTLAELAKKTRPEVVMLGDSITDNWSSHGTSAWAKHLKPLNAANFGIAGERTQSLLWRLTQGDYDSLEPKVVVVLIGTNNLKDQRNTPRETAAGVERVVLECRSRFTMSEVILLGILPCGDKPDGAHALGVKRVNDQIRHLDELDRVRFLDVSGAFLDSSGAVQEECMPDFLHPSAVGYERLAQRLAPAIIESLGPSTD